MQIHSISLVLWSERGCMFLLVLVSMVSLSRNTAKNGCTKWDLGKYTAHQSKVSSHIITPAYLKPRSIDLKFTQSIVADTKYHKNEEDAESKTPSVGLFNFDTTDDEDNDDEQK